MELFSFDQDWKTFAENDNLPIPSNAIPEPGPNQAPIKALDIDFSQARPYQAEVDKNWAANHPFSSIGYVSQPKTFVVHDGAELSVKVSCPSINRLEAKGIHAPYKAARSLRYSRPRLDFGVVTSRKRHSCYGPYTEISISSPLVSSIVLLLNTSSPLGLRIHEKSCASYSPTTRCLHLTWATYLVTCRSFILPVHGNIPWVSRNGHLKGYGEISVFRRGRRSPSLSSSWGDDRTWSTLGFAAGRDCLRDEGMLYAKKLEDNGVVVELHVYAGVPHNFAHYEESGATARCWRDLKQGLEQWITA